jgi:exosome complex exonuclease DIS3/RRP44
MVEELMLFANRVVAQRIYEAFPQSAVLRRHDMPVADKFAFVNHCLERFGLSLNPDNGLDLGRSLDAVKVSHPELDTVVRIMATRSMQLAKYFASGTLQYDQFSHFGLAMPIYTHFTSPIRRYADILVHRQLALACGCATPEETPKVLDKLEMAKTCDHLNYRNVNAQKAGRESAQLKTIDFLRERFASDDKPQRGVVMRVKKSSLEVLLVDWGVEGNVEMEDSVYLESEQALTSGSQTFHVFDELEVVVSISEMNSRGRSHLNLKFSSFGWKPRDESK